MAGRRESHWQGVADGARRNMAERGRKRPCGPGEHGQRVEWRKWKQQKKEEKKKWKDMKLTKKLEKQRAQEEQTKRQKEEEEAAAQRENQGVWLSWGGAQAVASTAVLQAEQRMSYLEESVVTTSGPDRN